MTDKAAKEILAPITEASPEVREIIIRVLEVEHSKLYLERPHIIDDLVQIIREVIQ